MNSYRWDEGHFPLLNHKEGSELPYAIVLWIEHPYNHRRRQRGLGKLISVEFELAFATRIDDGTT